MITIRGNRAESPGKGANARNKPWRCSKNAANSSESAGKCDINQRKWSKNYRKMKETGKPLGNIHWKCMKMQRRMVQKPMEERGENGRKHAVRKRWTKHTENPRRGCIGKCNETAGKHNNDQRKSCKITWKMEETGANARNKPWQCRKNAGKNTVKVQENVITTKGNGAKTIAKWRRRGGIKKSNRLGFYAKQGLVVLKMRMSLDQPRKNYIFIYLHIYIFTFIYIYIYLYLYICIFIYLLYICIYIYIYIFIYLYIYIFIYLYIYIFIYLYLYI